MFGPRSELHKLALSALEDTEPPAHSGPGPEPDPIRLYVNKAKELVASSAAAREGVDKVLENLINGHNELRANNLAWVERQSDFEKLQRRAGHYVKPEELPASLSSLGTMPERAIDETVPAHTAAKKRWQRTRLAMKALAKEDPGHGTETPIHEPVPASSDTDTG